MNRFVYPVCPSCSHGHDHDACSTRLHGFAAPLVIATLIHSLFDGWALTAARDSHFHGVGQAISVALWLHKLPESIAFGVVLKGALRSRAKALSWAVLAQIAVLAGAALEYFSAPYLEAAWITGLLAIGSGTFLFLGFHAIEGGWSGRRFAHPAPGMHVSGQEGEKVVHR